MLSMLVNFSSAQLAQSQAVAHPHYCPYSMLLCKNRRLFTVAGDNSHVLTPIPVHLIPIPIPWLILLPFPWESHGIPVFLIPMHTSNVCPPGCQQQTRRTLLQRSTAGTDRRTNRRTHAIRYIDPAGQPHTVLITWRNFSTSWLPPPSCG